jgi:hypothetical protein
MRLVPAINEMEQSLKDSDFPTRHRTVAKLALAHSWRFNRGLGTTLTCCSIRRAFGSLANPYVRLGSSSCATRRYVVFQLAEVRCRSHTSPTSCGGSMTCGQCRRRCRQEARERATTTTQPTRMAWCPPTAPANRPPEHLVLAAPRDEQLTRIELGAPPTPGKRLSGLAGVAPRA